MNQDTNICIAYIACRLISGKRIASLYDLPQLKEVETASLLDAAFLKEFDEKFADYVPGYASDCKYKYTAGNGNSIEIFINGRTFIVHINDTAAYFIGNVQGDIIYLYDHDNSAHFKYRILRCVEAEEKTGKAVELEN
jgi:hypothetical protein